LIGSESAIIGLLIHYLIGLIIGVTFGYLFIRYIHRTGSAVIWGLNYGLFWWIIGPLTLMPLFRFGTLPEWTLTVAQRAAPSLIAHLIYGSLVGLCYALINKVWHVLFVDSDPLNRTLKGAGTRGMRGAIMGVAGGIIGGLLFTIVMVGVGALPRVATLIGAQSAFVGFIVHLLISLMIGISYGLLFQREADSYGAGLAWGLLYGLLWWLLGSNTLFNMLLREPVDWSLAAIPLPIFSRPLTLRGGPGPHLTNQYLARRYDRELSRQSQPLRPCHPQTSRRRQRRPSPLGNHPHLGRHAAPSARITQPQRTINPPPFNPPQHIGVSMRGAGWWFRQNRARIFQKLKDLTGQALNC
jgi:hypothetical protein